MRTTVTLESDVVKLLRDAAHRGQRSFKAVLNDAVRSSLRAKPVAVRKRLGLPRHHMGQPTVDLTKANALAASLEDEELIRKLELGK